MTARTWRLERATVREDAPSLFVPGDELPEAVVGDHVVLVGTETGDEHRGSVVDVVDDAERGRFLVIDLERSG